MRGVPASGQLAFRALRNGSVIGTHSLKFLIDGSAMTVEIAVDYSVKIALIPVFRYRLRSREFWRDGVLMSARSETDDNGKPAWMRADREDDALVIQGSKSGTYRAPAGSILATHWNQDQLAAPMVNPQDGTLMHYKVTPEEMARIADNTGKVRNAQRFALTGKDGLDLWYDADGIWVALRAKARDGSTISYAMIG